jgi:hypothetical protein
VAVKSRRREKRKGRDNRKRKKRQVDLENGIKGLIKKWSRKWNQKKGIKGIHKQMKGVRNIEFLWEVLNNNKSESKQRYRWQQEQHRLVLPPVLRSRDIRTMSVLVLHEGLGKNVAFWLNGS